MAAQQRGDWQPEPAISLGWPFTLQLGTVGSGEWFQTSLLHCSNTAELADLQHVLKACVTLLCKWQQLTVQELAHTQT
jgi:hypothetical protein